MARPLSARRAVAYGALVLTAALWGSNPTASRLVMETVPPITVSWIRWLVVLVVLLPLVWPERAALARAVARDWKVFLPFALLGFAPQNVTVYLGLYGSSATHLSLLNSAIPVLIILIGWLGYSRRPHALEAIGLAISLLGVLLILGHGDLGALVRLDFNPWDLMLLLGMTIWAFYTIRLKDRPQSVSLIGFVFVAALMGIVIAAPVIAGELLWKGVPHFGTREVTGLLYIAVLPTLVGMLLFGFAVERVGPVQAGYFTHLVPVFGSLLAAAVLGEALHPYHGFGFLLVAGGAILGCLRQEPMLSSGPPAASAPRP